MPCGVIEYDEHGNPKCEICGKYFKRVLTHAYFKHHITEREYKETYGLYYTKGLCSKESSLKTSVKSLRAYQAGLLDNNFAKRIDFKKGYKGRTLDMICCQTFDMLVTQIKGVVKRRERIKRQKRGISEEFEQELLASIPKINSWAWKHYGFYYDEDITQETILEAMLFHYRYDKTSSMTTWLIGIMKHKYQRKQKKQIAHQNYVEEALHVELPYEEEEEEKSEYNLGVINEILSELTEKQRSIVADLINKENQLKMTEKYGKKNIASMKTHIYALRKLIQKRYWERVQAV